MAPRKTGPSNRFAVLTRPSLSVVIPCYNAAAWIVSSLSSVYAQAWDDLEVLVIDDGSTDESVAVVREHFPQATVLQQTNGGVAAARNAGLKAARGEWVAFIDADDHWLPGKLRAQMDLLTAHPEARMVCSGWQYWLSGDAAPHPELLDRLRLIDDTAAHQHGPSGWIYPELLQSCCVWTSTVVAQRELLLALDGFDTTLKVGEDYDLWLRASRVTPILRVQRALALYRQHPNSLTRQPPAKNWEGLVLQSALTRWGYNGPDGRSAEVRAVARSMARTWHAFGAANLRAGRTRCAWSSVREALAHDRWHCDSWKLAIKTVVQATWPWRRNGTTPSPAPP